MGSNYKYDAFISYRHTELDKFVAENLHKQLESFRLPKSIAKKHKGEKNKIERVFRDKEELPLTSNLEDPIVQALNSSEWLIVICSPRLRESMWCKKEIETFVKLRGREHVLAVLIEGEPADSFPDELLFKIEKHTLPDGTIEEVKIPVEPLAADVRGKDKKEVLKAMKTEVLRLLAAMFHLTYDDLRQRHRERRMRRILTASLIGGAACLLFGIYSTATALRIHRQNEQISAQSEEIKKQSEEISKQNEELALRQARSLAELASGYLDDGNRAAAIATATEALTESEGITLPYTPEAQMILTESVRAYDTGNVQRAEYQYETVGKIESVKISPDYDTLCIYDGTGTLTLFDLINREVIKTFGADEYGISGDYGCTFLGNDYFAYSSIKDKVCVYDLSKQSVIKELDADLVPQLHSDIDGNYLAVETWNKNCEIYDGKTLEKLGITPEIETSAYTKGPYLFSDGIFTYAYSTKDEQDEVLYTIYFVDLKTMEVISTYPIGTRSLVDITVCDGIAYMMTGEYADYYADCDAYASAVDISTGQLLWEYERKSFYPRGITYPVYEESTNLLTITDSTAELVDIKTGEVKTVVSLPSEVVNSYVYSNSNDFILYCEGGEMLVVSTEHNCSFDMSYMFECKTQRNEEIFHSKHGIVVWEHNDKKITVYTQSAGPDITPIETAYELPESNDEIKGNQAIDIVRSYGLEKPEFVNTLYYSEDNKYCFILYWDYSMAIYDTEEEKLCNTIEDAYPTEWCLGTDSEGYTYLLGYYGCYVLNQDMVPVMWIEEANAVDMENRKVYLNWNKNYYEAPLYTVEELIEMAKSYNK